MSNLITRGDVRLANRLESVDSLRIAFSHLHHLAKTPLPDDLEQLERINSNRLALRHTMVRVSDIITKTQ